MRYFIIFFFTILPLTALEIEKITDTQVLMSIAWHEYDRKQLGDAFIIAEKAWSGTANSEASYLMGLIYEAQGENLMAKRYYDRALAEDRHHVSRTKYLYSIAHNYRLSENDERYIETLKIIEKEALPRELYEVTMRQRDQAVKILIANGLNRVVEMYRWNADSSLTAIEAIALHAYQSAQDVDALQGFLYAFIAKSGVILNRLAYYRPDYQFKSVEQMLDDAMVYQELRNYIDDSQFFRSYYFLSLSIRNYSGSSQSKIILNRIRQRPDAGIWAKKAQNQFEQPFNDRYTLSDRFNP